MILVAPASEMPSSRRPVIEWMRAISCRLYRRWPPTDRDGRTAASASSRRKNAGWTPSMSATWPIV
jgi:hypothetical protein